MPELPEVETLRRDLEPALKGREILAIDVLPPSRFEGLECATGRTIAGVSRRGKYFLFDLGDRELLVHLGMSGWLHPGTQALKGVRAVVRLSGGQDLTFTDPRRFGTLDVVAKGAYQGHPTLARLGPEPLSDDFDPEAFVSAVAGRDAPIKAILLEQRAVAGLGNIYSDEALWRAKIHPARRRLDSAEAKRMYEAIRDTISEAVGQRGLEVGTYRLRVHDRPGQPCSRCLTPIERIALGGRSTDFCSICQPPNQASPALAAQVPRSRPAGKDP